jgi:hypothetical protein
LFDGVAKCFRGAMRRCKVGGRDAEQASSVSPASEVTQQRVPQFVGVKARPNGKPPLWRSSGRPTHCITAGNPTGIMTWPGILIRAFRIYCSLFNYWQRHFPLNSAKFSLIDIGQKTKKHSYKLGRIHSFVTKPQGLFMPGSSCGGYP